MTLATRVLTPERMDTDCRDYADYRACLRDLARVNTVTLTHRPILAWLRRASTDLASFSLLDVGCGGGDALRRIHRQAIAWGRQPDLTGLDLHPWSIRAAQEATSGAQPIRYVNADVFTFAPDKPFDFIVSSQFTHHLTDDEIVRFIRWMDANARRGWFTADLRRHPFPFTASPCWPVSQTGIASCVTTGRFPSGVASFQPTGTACWGAPRCRQPRSSSRRMSRSA